VAGTMAAPVRTRAGSALVVLLLTLAGAGLGDGAVILAPAGATEASPQGALPAGGRLSLYLAEGERNNAGLGAARQETAAAREEPAIAGGWPEPQVSYAHFIEPIETRVGPQQRRYGLAQRIPWFGTLGARREAAEARADVVLARQESRRQALFYEIKQRYYEIYYAEQAMAITARKIELLEQLEEVARAKYATGQGSQTALLRLQLRAQQLRDGLAQLAEQAAIQRALFNAALNRPGETALEGAVDLPVIDYAAVLADRATASVARNPSLTRWEAAGREAQAQVRLAAKRAYPDFTIGVQYMQTGEALERSMRDSGKDPWLVSLSLNLPLYGGTTRAWREQAAASRQAAFLTWQEESNRLAALATAAGHEITAHQRSIDLHQGSLLPLATQALEVTVREYIGGRIAYLEVIDAEQAQLALELNLARAQADRGIGLARLEQLLGHPLDRAHAPAGASDRREERP